MIMIQEEEETYILITTIPLDMDPLLFCIVVKNIIMTTI
jgi:hypothetical protein